MTAESFQFNGVLTGTLLMHLLGFALFFTLPGSRSGETVTIYRVNVVEAPARPKVRDVKVSTRAISELKLEAPSLRPELLPPEAPESPSAAPEILPPTPPGPILPAATALPAPEAPPTAPEAPLQAPPAAALPRLPTAPPDESALPKTAPPVPERPARPAAPPLPPAMTGLPRAELSPMERLRSKVAGLEVRFEEVPAQGVKSSPRSKSASSLLSLGLYRNRAEEAVRENFTFPGGFAKGLQARIRLTIERDGTVSLAEVLKSSGDEKFDYAAKLAWRRTKFPPISSDIERDRITWVFSFSP